MAKSEGQSQMDDLISSYEQKGAEEPWMADVLVRAENRLRDAANLAEAVFGTPPEPDLVVSVARFLASLENDENRLREEVAVKMKPKK